MLVRHQSTVKIKDDIATLNVSRQRKYQLRKMREGLCIICGEKVFKDTLFCFDHNLKRGIEQPGRNRKHAMKKWGFQQSHDIDLTNS